MPKILGKAVRVVEHDGLTIDEFVGNVSTKDDTVSIAHVTVAKPTAEPWLTLDYEEWLCVLEGQMDLHSRDGTIVTVMAGETAFIDKGETFRPMFPVANTVYIPVCRPAFSPERCTRHEEGLSDVSAKLQELHGKDKDDVPAAIDKSKYDSIDTLYHMCQQELWDDAKAAGKAYFPPTFVADGMFTHATAVPQRLITTANHFYTATKGDWICLELSRSALYKLGIDTVFEEAKPVGEAVVSDNWQTWVCPHVYGGFPTTIDGIVTKTYAMKRSEDGTFLSIDGISE